MKLTFTGLLAIATLLVIQTPLFAQTQQNPEDKAVVYEYADQMPEYKGGMEAMIKYLSGSIPYVNSQVQGKVFVSFVVDTDGTVDEVKVVKGLDPELDSVCVQAVQNMSGHWNPGVQKGEPVKVRYTLPINFSMGSSNSSDKKLTEKMPEYKGGLIALQKFMKKNIRYPRHATKNGVVHVTFVINEDGSLSDYEIKDSVEPALDEEALRIVRLSDGNWIPAEQNGKKVRFRYTVPIRF